MEYRKTSRKATFKLNGKRYTRKVYEFIDPASKWWRACVVMYGNYIPLDWDLFEDVNVRDEGAYMPGTWAN